MKTTIGSIFTTAFVGLLLLWGYLILDAHGTCARIDKALIPIRLGALAVSQVMHPWIDESGEKMIQQKKVSFSLSTARFLQKYNGNVTCPWDGIVPQEKPLEAVTLPDLPARGQ